MSVSVKLAERPRAAGRSRGDDAPSARRSAPGPASSGLSLIEIDDSNAHRFDMPAGMTGLLVQRVEPLSVGLRRRHRARRDHPRDQPPAGELDRRLPPHRRRGAARRRAGRAISTSPSSISAPIRTRPHGVVGEATHPGHRRRGRDPRLAEDDPRVRGLRRDAGAPPARKASRWSSARRPTWCSSTSRCRAWTASRCCRSCTHLVEVTPIVVISGHADISTAVEATRLGAFDFIEKPLEQRARARHGAQRRRHAAAQDREHDAAGATPEKKYQIVGDIAGAGRGARRDPEGRADQRHRADLGRERRRQGAGGARRSTARACAATARSCRSTAPRSPTS